MDFQLFPGDAELFAGGDPVKVGRGDVRQQDVYKRQGRSDAFQIYPNHAAFGVIVKMGVLHGTGSKHQAVTFRTSQGIVFFLKRAFHGSKRCV